MWLAIWYPSLENEASYTYNTSAAAIEVTGKVAENATVAEGSWPLVIFSHGFSGGGIGSIEICEALARAGYVVVAPDHSDAVLNVRVNGSASGTISDALTYLSEHPFEDGAAYTYRIAEVQAAMASIKANAAFHIDPNKIALGGHSMGGWTAMKAMEQGAEPTAMFLLSMGELNWLFQEQRYFEAPFFQAFDFPTAYFYGGVEYSQAVSAGRDNVYAAYCFANSPSPSYGLLVAQGNHFTYNSQAIAPDLYGQEFQLELINKKLINFLDRHVKELEVSVTDDPLDVTK